jgi:hypothetical protein
VLIPIAAGVLYLFAGVLISPILSSAAMAFSSVLVLTNSLRLRGFGHPLRGPELPAGTIIPLTKPWGFLRRTACERL